MKKLYLIIIALVLIMVVGLVCFKLGFVAGKNAERKLAEAEIAQYKKVIDYYFPVAEESFSLSGKITDIQDKFINLKTVVEDPYALPENWETKTVKVIIAEETKFTTFDMEIGEEIEISFSDLKVGDEIIARADKNIKGINEFEAVKISLSPSP